jgi:CBS domain-containing protein
MSKLAKEIMTPAPQCCAAETSLQEVATLMLEADCGEIPITDAAKRVIGVITDRDIVCRVVAKGKNPASVTAGECMSNPVVVVSEKTPISSVMQIMEENQIRRVPVVDESDCLTGIISQADVALNSDQRSVGELVREVSKESPLGVTH